MKVVLGSYGFYPKIGGVENSLLSFGKIFIQNGWEVVVLTTTDGVITNNMILKDRFFGFDVIRINIRKFIWFYNLPILSALFSVLILSFGVWSNKKHFTDSSFIIARDYRVLLAFKMIFWKKKTIYVIPGFVKHQDKYHLYGATYKRFFKKVLHRFNILLQDAACRLSDNVFVFSEVMKSEAMKIRKDIIQVEPGVELKRFYFNVEARRVLREKYKIGINSRVVLCLGRLEEQKGFVNVLRAWKYVTKCNFLFIVGSGSLDNYLKKEVNNLKLENVIFVGKTHLPENYFSMADIFFHSSTYEPFGQTLLEAAASGISILALDKRYCVTATHEIMGGSIEYVELNYLSIAQKLDTISLKKNRVENIYKEVLQKYTWENCLNSILSNVKSYSKKEV